MRKETNVILLKRVLLSALLVPALAASGENERRFDLQWTIALDGVPAGAKEAVVWIALPQELPEQIVERIDVRTTWPWDFVADPDFGNRVARVSVAPCPSHIDIALEANVTRKSIDGSIVDPLDDRRRALLLREESLVSLSRRVRAIADSIGHSNRDRYDYVLDVMDYDKSTPGWGRGDTERACDIGKGNCTDFHSLFMSLSRARGVPALFEMGYPTRPEGESGRAGGYHCWAWFWSGDRRTAVDISEADRHPEKVDFFFGRLDADRITFSRGRDVRLPGMKGKPLNYLPSGAYAEVDGAPFDGVTQTLSYTVK